MSEAWSQWQGQLIDGKFHLVQYLGGSRESAVFLAHLSSNDDWLRDEHPQRVAIRLIANSENAELQLSRWRMAQGLSHPHLIRILDTGRCRPGEIDLIYAVMEYGEENLAQIVPERPLTVEEARQMLGPVLETITYLHARGLVHGHLKPSNILAIADQLKLSTDAVCPADQPVASPDATDAPDAPAALDPSAPARGAGLEIYDAPETARGIWSPAADVWSLGMTLAEVLTQKLPSHTGEREADALLPLNLPVEFVEIVRGCLRRDLDLRWTIPAIKTRLESDLRQLTKPAVESAPQLPMSPEPADTAPVPTETPAPGQVEVQAEQHPPAAAFRIDPVMSALEDSSDSAASAALPIKPEKSAVPPPATFAQALRGKPVVSEQPVIEQESMPRVASAGAAFSPTEYADSVAHPEAVRIVNVAPPPIRIVDPSIRARAPERLSVERSNLQDLIEPEEPGVFARTLAMLSEARDFISAAAAATRRFTLQTIATSRRVTSRTQTTIQNITSDTRTMVRRVASRTREILGPYPGQMLLRLGLAVLILGTAAAALVTTLRMLSYNSNASPTTAAPGPAAPMKPAKAERKPVAKKHESAKQAKPKPGTPQASAQPQAHVQPVSLPVNPQPAAPTAPANTQTASRSDLQPSVRRIDDGGAEDDAIHPSPAAAGNTQAAPVNVGIAHEVLPQVSQSALHTIHGTVRVTVKVRVDPSGNVARAELASSGPSRYFARKSLEAAQSWKFAPGQGSPFSVVHFEYRYNGARAFATRLGS